jgi:hypothetical protein
MSQLPPSRRLRKRSFTRNVPCSDILLPQPGRNNLDCWRTRYVKDIRQCKKYGAAALCGDLYRPLFRLPSLHSPSL